MRNLIFQVIASWQVWVVTIALVIYISLVRYVGRLDSRRSRPASAPKGKKEKSKGKMNAAASSKTPKTDELGLEEGDVAIEEE